MQVSRSTFVQALRANPTWEPCPVEGKTISAMQYLNETGQVQATAIYSSPVARVRVIISYTLRERQGGPNH